MTIIGLVTTNTKFSLEKNAQYHVLFSLAFEPHVEELRGLLLALHSKLIPGGLRGPYKVLWIKPEPAVYNANALPAVLLLWPPFVWFCLVNETKIYERIRNP